MQNPKREYWTQRFEKLESESYQKGINYVKDIESEYRKAVDNCERNIAKWYQRLADNNGISMLEAKKLLNKDELAEFKWNVSEYIKYGKENSVNGKWIKELENASAKVHITKYEQIKLELENEANVLYSSLNSGTEKLLNDIYKTNYKETESMLGHTGSGFDTNRVVGAVQKPWAVDGKNFSDRIWQSKDNLVNSLNTHLTQNIIRGESYTKAVKAVKDDLNVSYSNAKRLVVTETAAIQTKARKDCLKALDCEYYEISVAADERVCSVCGSFADLGPQNMKDFQVGVTAPPFHPSCRCAVVPWYEEVNEESSENVRVEQTQKITNKSTENNFSVDRILINSKEYHNKFENLTSHKFVNESIYQEAMKILEHRDGTEYEDLVALDSRTGKVISINDKSTKAGSTGFTKEQYGNITNNINSVVLLHNHPNSSRPSFTDIKTLFKEKSVNSSVIIGHDGEVHIITNPNRRFDIDGYYKEAYNKYMEVYNNKGLAQIKSLNDIYDMGVFRYEKG